MSKGRLEAFSDGVMAIIITIMVLDLRAPADPKPAALDSADPGFAELRAELRVRGHLLEQPSSPVAGGAPRQWPGPVGQPAPTVLALAHAIRHKLDGANEISSLARRGVWRSAPDGGYRLFPDSRAP